MSDQRKFMMLAGASIVLVLLVMTYDSFLGPSFSSFFETSKRRHHFEQVIEKKGLTLHEGVFWKSKE